MNEDRTRVLYVRVEDRQLAARIEEFAEIERMTLKELVLTAVQEYLDRQAAAEPRA